VILEHTPQLGFLYKDIYKLVIKFLLHYTRPPSMVTANPQEWGIGRLPYLPGAGKITL
jgi:hypothetical protein